MSWQEKRRENRIDLIPGKELTVTLEPALVARVRNVSLRGCNLVFGSSTERVKAPVDKVFSATLELSEFLIPLKVKVVRWVGETDAGVQFKPPFPKELAKLERFLEPRFLGRSLREIDPKLLQKATPEGMRWFQGVNETNLFSWRDQQQLVFLDHVIEWKNGGSLRTGRIRQDGSGSEGGINWVKSDLLDFDATVDESLMSQAQALLESAHIDADVKQQFLEKLRSRP